MSDEFGPSATSHRLPTTDHGVVYQLAAAPFGWYAACASGLYRSVDAGASWQPAYASLGAESALATLCVATASGGENASLVFAGLSGELLRSVDGGEMWEIASRPSPAPVFTALVASPTFARDGLLFAGTLDDGVLRYESAGRTWAIWNFGLMDTSVLCLAISPAFGEDATLYAGVQSGLFRSANGGLSWQEIDLPGGYGAVLSVALSPRFEQDGVIYAGIEDGGLLRSADRGESWQRVGEQALTESINNILIDSFTFEQPALLVLHGTELLISTDDGDSWAAWRDDRLGEQEVTAVLAPQGLNDNAPVLVGLSDGTICTV